MWHKLSWFLYHNRVGIFFLSESALQTIKSDVAQMGSFLEVHTTHFFNQQFGINSLPQRTCMYGDNSKYSVANNT